MSSGGKLKHNRWAAMKQLCIGYKCLVCGERVTVFRSQPGGETVLEIPKLLHVSCSQGHPSTIDARQLAFLDHWAEEV